jgi:hypothetical protein
VDSAEMRHVESSHSSITIRKSSIKILANSIGTSGENLVTAFLYDV